MKTKNRINEKFLRDNLVDTISRYQLYYQIALGTYIKETSKDESSFDLAKKIEDINLDIELEDVLNTMVRVITTFNEEENFEDFFEDNIKVNAMIHSLKNYIEKCADLKDKDAIYDKYYNKIIEDEFYDVKMNITFDDEMEDRLIHWKGYIDDEAADKLKKYALKAL